MYGHFGPLVYMERDNMFFLLVIVRYYGYPGYLQRESLVCTSNDTVLRRHEFQGCPPVVMDISSTHHIVETILASFILQTICPANFQTAILMTPFGALIIDHPCYV